MEFPNSSWVSLYSAGVGAKEMSLLLSKRIKSLYRRCLQAAARCPRAEDKATYRLLTGFKFREPCAPEHRARRLEEGEEELRTMYSYFAAATSRAQPTASETTKQINCVSCGTPYSSARARFCAECGTPRPSST